MNTLSLLILVGGILHFGILLASFSVPKVLQWKQSLNKLDELSRQLIWIHGAYIVLVIIAFGTASVVLANDLASGSRLARATCAFIGVFWGIRLMAQFLVLDVKPMLQNRWLKVGYHGLTLTFAYHTVVYSLAALLGNGG